MENNKKSLIDIIEEYQRSEIKEIFKLRYTEGQVQTLKEKIKWGSTKTDAFIFFIAHSVHMFQLPLDEMPLYLNSNPRDTWNKHIAEWRLECGK